MSPWIEIVLFSGKAIVVLLIIAALLVLIATLILRSRDFRPNFEIDTLNDTYKDLEFTLKQHLIPDKELKKQLKAEKKRQRDEEKTALQRRIFVLDFEGDIKASAVENLRKEITAILTVADFEKDEVLLRLESQGGMVHSYGLAASQLDRIRSRGLKLTVSVDKVAASGGYMMAVIGNKILAAPFAIIGSIGVVAQVPNIHRLLKKFDVDYQELTAGEYKRTVSLFGEITDKGRNKFLEQLEDTHGLFKDFIGKYRPQLDLSAVATGEYWFGERALGLGLIDQLGTSDDYLFQLKDQAKIVKIKVAEKQKLADKIAEMFSNSLESALHRWLKLNNDQHFPC